MDKKTSDIRNKELVMTDRNLRLKMRQLSKQTDSSSRLQSELRQPALLAVLVALVFCPAENCFSQTPDGTKAKTELSELVPSLRKKNELVGLGAMVMIDGKVVDSAVDGERIKGSGTKIQISDRWHLGSITKSITATTIARLIESENMSWADTVGSCFPDEPIHEDWKSVTLRQLLTHTSGAPPNFSAWVSLQFPKIGAKCAKARRTAVLKLMANEPTVPPGTKFEYSNVGYTIAGAMAEQATGVPWSDLVKREVFEPLGLKSGGFGPPRSVAGKAEQPQGHVSMLWWKNAVGEDNDNTPIIGPAGTVHMTLNDLCLFATEHLRGELGIGTLLESETFKKLHTVELDDYACGWMKPKLPTDCGHSVYWHNGSNTMWFALVVFIPETRMVIAVATNDTANADQVAWEIVNASAPSDLAKIMQQSGEYARKSPFAAVRWNGDLPEVKLGSEWFRLIRLNDVSVEEIMAFSEDTYSKLARKRFEEDLVELLTLMGHPPEDSVTLTVASLTTNETIVKENVAMTSENREAIRNDAKSK